MAHPQTGSWGRGPKRKVEGGMGLPSDRSPIVVCSGRAPTAGVARVPCRRQRDRPWGHDRKRSTRRRANACPNGILPLRMERGEGDHRWLRVTSQPMRARARGRLPWQSSSQLRFSSAVARLAPAPERCTVERSPVGSGDSPNPMSKIP